MKSRITVYEITREAGGKVVCTAAFSGNTERMGTTLWRNTTACTVIYHRAH
jgi:hypothetical protein